MPSIDQIRAARALLNWSQTDLADKAGLSQAGIARIETGDNTPNSKTLDKIRAAFEDGGVEFIDNDGIRRRQRSLKSFKGQSGLIEFMNDVYETARTQGGDICLFNAKPTNWLKILGDEWCAMHGQRMAAIKDRFTFRVAAQEDDDFSIGQGFAEYRWIPKSIFNDRTFYCYGDKLAFLDFREDGIDVLVVEQEEFARGFRSLFDLGWNASLLKTPAGPKG